MKLEALGTQEKLAKDATHKVTITHEDLTEAVVATAQVIELKNVLAGHIAEVIGGKLVTPFKDASDAAFNTTSMDVGDGTDPNFYVAGWETNENGAEEDYEVGLGTRAVYLAADTIDLTVNSMAAKALADIDTGELEIYLKIIDLS